MVITPENFSMIRWKEHCQRGVTDGQTDGRTDGNKCFRAAWSQLKIIGHHLYIKPPNHHLKPPSEFKLELLSGNAQFRSKSAIFLSRVTLKFDKWPWKKIGHLLYGTLRFVHHFKAIGELKLKLQSGNSQFGSKSAIFLSRVTLKFDVLKKQ